MKIRKLARAKNCAVFRDYTWPTALPELEERVLIYGWNGAGKTSFASILREAETGHRSFQGGEWELATDSAPIRSSAVPASLPIRVFDSEFVADSVFTTDERELAPVLYVGRGTRAKQERLEDCGRELVVAEERVLSLSEARLKAERTLDEFFADQAKLIKEALRSNGPNPFNNYNKADYRRRVEQIAELGSPPSLLADSERARLRSTKDLQAMPTQRRLENGIACSADSLHDIASLLAGVPATAALERLASDPAVGRWAEAGLQLHEERASQACLFCTATLSPGILADLRRHFDRAFRDMVDRISEALEETSSIRGRAESVQPPSAAELSPGLRRQYEEELAVFARRRAEFVVGVRLIESALLAKRDSPFAALQIDPSVPEALYLDLGQLNAIITSHNEEQGDLAGQVAGARQALADDLILQQWRKVGHLQAQIEGTDADLVKATLARDQLRAEESSLKEEVIEHETAAAELTAELAAFLGRDDLTFSASGTGYTISRNGAPAKGLSEGERSAIALLYFLKTLSDRAFDRSTGVVVIDDPISSLDSNALFCALGYIQAKTEDIGQLIFLTHNFAFFRELRKWLMPIRGKPPWPSSAYCIRCVGPRASRHSTLEVLDELLRKYDSEYQYLFKLVYEASLADGRGSLEQLFHYPNVARRLLEAFFAFRMPDVSESGLRGRLKQTSLDDATRERMLRFLDFQSHKDGVDIPEEDLSSLAEASTILKEVLDLMQDQDKKHFDRMCRLVVPPPSIQ
jgi:wobble nucleotide-excising tRNase